MSIMNLKIQLVYKRTFEIFKTMFIFQPETAQLTFKTLKFDRHLTLFVFLTYASYYFIVKIFFSNNKNKNIAIVICGFDHLM